MSANDLWKGLNLPAELRPYMTLSHTDVMTLTVQARAAANPKAKLEELLIAKATEKKEAATRHDTERMTEDRRRIEDTDRWPLPWLPVKTQPWITNQEGRMRHGYIEPEDLTTVHVDGKEPTTYPSLAELVAYWSVD